MDDGGGGVGDCYGMLVLWAALVLGEWGLGAMVYLGWLCCVMRLWIYGG